MPRDGATTTPPIGGLAGRLEAANNRLRVAATHVVRSFKPPRGCFRGFALPAGGHLHLQRARLFEELAGARYVGLVEKVACIQREGARTVFVADGRVEHGVGRVELAVVHCGRNLADISRASIHAPAPKFGTAQAVVEPHRRRVVRGPERLLAQLCRVQGVGDSRIEDA